MLQKLGVIQLPTARTLCDYKHLSASQSGLSAVVDQQLLNLIRQAHPKYYF